MSRATRSSARVRKSGADAAAAADDATAVITASDNPAAHNEAAAEGGNEGTLADRIGNGSQKKTWSSRVRARSQERRHSVSSSPPQPLLSASISANPAGNGIHGKDIIHDDDDDDPARPSWGFGRRYADANDVQSPVGVLGRTLCCAGGRGSLSWLGMGIVCSALALASLGIHLLVEVLGDKLDVWGKWLGSDSGGVVSALAIFGTMLVIVAVPLTHGIVGVRRHGVLSYTFWQPFVGGMRFVLLQVLAWTIWTITVLAGIYGAWVGTKHLTTGWFSAVGVGGVVSQLLVLISLHFFVSGVSTKQRQRTAAELHRPPGLHRTLSEGAIPAGEVSPESWVPVTPVTEKEEPVAPMEPSAVVPPTPGAPAVGEKARSPTAAAAGSPWPFGSAAMKITFLVVASVSLLLALFVESDAHALRDGVSPLLSLFTSAILLAVPVTHLLARRSLTHAGYLLFQPFKGGRRFVALQAVAWTLWTLAFISAGASFFFVLSQKQLGNMVPDSIADGASHIMEHVPGDMSRLRWITSLVTSAGVGGVLSQALVLLSLKYFDSKLSTKIGHQARVIQMVRQASHAAAAALLPESMAGSTPAASSPAHRRSVTPQQVVGPSAGKVGTASPAATTPMLEERDVYARATQVLSSPISHQLLSSPNPRLLLAELPGTTGLSPRAGISPRVGSITPKETPSSSRATRSTTAAEAAAKGEQAADESPLTLQLPAGALRSSISPRGTPIAPVTPTIGGVIPSPTATAEDGSLVLGSVSSAPEADGEADGEVEVEGDSLASLSLGDLTQSFHLYRHQLGTLDLRAWVMEACADVAALSVVAAFYLVPLLGAALTCGPLFVFALHWENLPWWVYTLYGSCVMFYLSTYRNRPSLTGSRSWDAVRHNTLLWAAMERYFKAQIIPLGKLSEAQGPYVMGFHPHGVYPASCLWSTRGPSFRLAYPDLHVDVCGATIMFYAPLLRDVCMWTGGREVSGSALRIALKQRRSILIVPGGQREMRHSAANPHELVLVTRHRGFIRLALEHGTPLVPVLSLGETMLLENVRAPRMQAYTLRTMGVGFPIWPYGRWFSPLPNPHPVAVIFGHPMPLPKQEKPSPELVEQVHTAYYAQLRQMFEQHKHLVPGFEKCKLVFTED